MLETGMKEGLFFRLRYKLTRMESSAITVFIIDDDPSIRKSLSLLLSSHGFETECYSCSEEFLSRLPIEGIGCILLDLQMDGINGLELQEKLSQHDKQLPIIFLSGQGNISSTVRALRAGAITFLEKPCLEDELLKAISEAMTISQKRVKENQSLDQARQKLNALTPREREVLKLVVTGMLNKQVAGELSITEHTVKLHRQHITEKLGVKSVAEIVRITQLSELGAIN